MKKFNFYISEGGRTGFNITIIAEDRDDAMKQVVKRYPGRGLKRILTNVDASSSLMGSLTEIKKD